MTQAKAQHYIDNCRSRRRYYRVLVFESGLRSPETLDATDDISRWAYRRALSALDECEDAVAGIGLQSTLLRLITGHRIIPVRMAAAAVVQRNDLSSPIILVTTNAGLDDQAKLVAQALSSWRTHAPKNFSGKGPVINALARRAVGL